MKKMRFVSIALAACMVLACMLPAGAAEQSPDIKRSAYAGTTMNVKVIDMDTNVSRAIQVAIPASATEAQEVALVQNAVAASSNAAVSRAVTRGAVDQISRIYFNNPLVASTETSVGGGKVVHTVDFLDQTEYDVPRSDVMLYETDNGLTVIVRPSGTEPLIKFYITAAKSEEENAALFAAAISDIDRRFA